MSSPPLPGAAAITASILARHIHCIYCGRALVDVEDDGLWDEQTGQRERIVWRQCPKYPRSSWQAMTTRASYRHHDSFRRDNPLSAREWR